MAILKSSDTVAIYHVLRVFAWDLQGSHSPLCNILASPSLVAKGPGFPEVPVSWSAALLQWVRHRKAHRDLWFSRCASPRNVSGFCGRQNTTFDDSFLGTELQCELMISAMGLVGATRLFCQVASVKHFGPSLTRRNELESADDDQSVRHPQKVLAVHQGALCVCIFFYPSDGYSLSS